MTFEYLFTPLKLGSTTLRNRIALPPHGVQLGGGYGPSTDRIGDYYIERAKGGAALIIMSNLVVPPSVKRLGSWNDNLNLSAFGQLDNVNEPALMPAYRRMIDGIHDNGAKFFAQLNAGGRQFYGPGSVSFGIPLLAPSPIPCPKTRQIPKEMTLEDIEEHIDAYGQGALNMREAGADGVEVFAAQGYLIHEFLSPASNWRTDQYGGSLENRMRFLLEAIASVRKAAGSDFVVGVRMNGDDFSAGGIDLPMAQQMAQSLVATGQVDYLNISGMTYLQFPAWIADMTAPPAMFAEQSAAIRASVPGTPVCVVSRIESPDLAEQLIRDGKTDFVGMVRALISDPELPNKARSGNLNDIRRCTYSNHCVATLLGGRGMSCIHNVSVGKEAQIGIGKMRPARKAKRVVVVGGGPSGMTAARVATERGHLVTLLEKAPRLGGQNLMTASIATRRQFGEVTRWLEHQLERLQVDVRRNETATAQSVIALDPDAIIVATGSKPSKSAYTSLRPGIVSIPGLDQDNVLTVWDVFQNAEKVGHRVLVLDDDPHLAGAYVAEHIADKGSSVQLVTPQLHPARDLYLPMIPELYQRLANRKVEISTNLILKEIVADKAIFSDRFSAAERIFSNIDSIVLSTGNRVEDALFHELKDAAKEIYAVGDSIAPRRLDDAILDGERAGWML